MGGGAVPSRRGVGLVEYTGGKRCRDVFAARLFRVLGSGWLRGQAVVEWERHGYLGIAAETVMTVYQEAPPPNPTPEKLN